MKKQLGGLFGLSPYIIDKEIQTNKEFNENTDYSNLFEKIFVKIILCENLYELRKLIMDVSNKTNNLEKLLDKYLFVDHPIFFDNKIIDEASNEIKKCYEDNKNRLNIDITNLSFQKKKDFIKNLPRRNYSYHLAAMSEIQPVLKIKYLIAISYGFKSNIYFKEENLNDEEKKGLVLIDIDETKIKNNYNKILNRKQISYPTNDTYIDLKTVNDILKDTMNILENKSYTYKKQIDNINDTLRRI